MKVEEFREYCLSLKGVEEKMPFVNVADRYSRDVLCFYVGDKWFCFGMSKCSIFVVLSATRWNRANCRLVMWE